MNESWRKSIDIDHGDSYLVNDDSCGNLEPLINFTASRSATLALFVASANGAPWCYHYRVAISGATTPTPSPMPSPSPTPRNASLLDCVELP